jgi:tRNA threonylcarbamoyladenosine biosynthesis protein TsaB
MALLLNINTATEHASVCLSNNGQVVTMLESQDQKNHGAFLQPAIQQLCLTAHVQLSQLDAIAVTEGPGSYTGLRVGLASAKGLCYALKKPLIALNTLKVMAAASLQHTKLEHLDTTTLFCPMIDARRMEVFTALYTSNLQEAMPPSALILTTGSFQDELAFSTIVFSGNGSLKCSQLIQHPNAQYNLISQNASHMISLAEAAFDKKIFADLAYSEPFYLKEFYSPALKH